MKVNELEANMRLDWIEPRNHDRCFEVQRTGRERKGTGRVEIVCEAILDETKKTGLSF